METLNKVFDIIMSGKTDFTPEELATAITEQIKKVLNFIVNKNTMLEMATATLYILLSAKGKKLINFDDFPVIGISNPINAKFFEEAKIAGYEYAKAFISKSPVFVEKVI